MPKRIQRKRTKGWRLPHGATCVTRPGKWGNPYWSAAVFREQLQFALRGALERDNSRTGQHMKRIARDIHELKGFDLACWCSLDKECHADVLLEYANAVKESPEKFQNRLSVKVTGRKF